MTRFLNDGKTEEKRLMEMYITAMKVTKVNKFNFRFLMADFKFNLFTLQDINAMVMSCNVTH